MHEHLSTYTYKNAFGIENVSEKDGVVWHFCDFFDGIFFQTKNVLIQRDTKRKKLYVCF